MSPHPVRLPEPDLRCEKFHNAAPTDPRRAYFGNSGHFSRDDGATVVSRVSAFGWFRPVVAFSVDAISENEVHPKLNWVCNLNRRIV